MRHSILLRVILAALLVLPWTAAGNLSARADVGDLTSMVLTPLAAGNDAITSVGVQRGRGMERESLGLAVASGAVLEARVTNGVAGVALSLMTDDHTTDVESGTGYQPGNTSLPTDGSWRRITAVADSGVFARTRAWETSPRIEYRVVSGTSFTMPSYRLGDAQAQFVAAWESSNSPFAVVVDRSFTMLLPRVDLPKVKDMGWSDFEDLDAAISFYRKLMSTYDGWLGVSDSDPSSLHKNLAQAPFMRPDRTGWGLAYYSGGNYIGTNVGSVSYYLRGPASWLILHEIGHGYDGIMTSAAGPGDIQLGEVWNNVYGYQYQTLVNGMTGSNWLNGTSKPVDQRRRDENRRRAGGVVDFNGLGYQDKLDFVARIADLTGPSGFASFNRSLRELRSTPGFSAWPARKDLIAQRWGGAQDHNLSPWFDAYSLPLSAAVEEDLYDVAQLPIALPLSDLFDDASQAQSAANTLQLDSPGDLVSSTRTATLGATGDVVVTANTHSAADIEGRIVSLWRGDTEVASAPFRDGVATFSSVPIGAHAVRFPLARATGVVPKRQWVPVRQSRTASSVTVEYPASPPAPSLDASVLTLHGLGDNTFASVEHDPVASTLTVTDTLVAPHSYFDDEYAKVTVSHDGKVLFERSFIGSQARDAAASTTLPAANGTTITITHREPGRVSETDPATGAPKPSLNATEPITTWRVTDRGLVKLDDSGNWDEQAAVRDQLRAVETALVDLRTTVAEEPTALLSARAAALRVAINRLPNVVDRERLSSAFGSLLTSQIALADRPAPSPSVSPTPSPSVSTTPEVTPSTSPSPSPSASATPTSSASSSTTATSTTSTPTATSTTSRPPGTPSATTKPTPSTSSPAPFDVYSSPGHHTFNGRQWFTACESYSQTTRCRTDIWGTTVRLVGGRFVRSNGWVFNNLTYLPSPRSLWQNNPLGKEGTWVAADGRAWRTECDSALTGRNGCRSWTVAKVVETTPKRGGGYTYAVVSKEIFNNIVRFS